MPLLLAVLPDGSRSLDFQRPEDGLEVGKLGPKRGRRPKTDRGDGLLCTISDLLKARAIADALLSRLTEVGPGQEGDHAVGGWRFSNEPQRRRAG